VHAVAPFALHVPGWQLWQLTCTPPFQVHSCVAALYVIVAAGPKAPAAHVDE
jgi:hypothetical protein